MGNFVIECTNGDRFFLNVDSFKKKYPEIENLILDFRKQELMQWIKNNLTWDQLLPWLKLEPKQNYNYDIELMIASFS